MIKTIIITACACILLLGSFIGGLFVGSYFVTTPVLTTLGNAFDTSDYTEGELLVLIKDTSGVTFRHFASPDELIRFIDGWR